MRDPRLIDEAITALTARVVTLEQRLSGPIDAAAAQATFDAMAADIARVAASLRLVPEAPSQGSRTTPVSALLAGEDHLAASPEVRDGDAPPGSLAMPVLSVIDVGTVVLFHPGIGKTWCEATVRAVEPDGTLLLDENGITWRRGPLQVAVRP